MNERTLWIVGAVAVIAIAAGLYYWRQTVDVAPPTTPPPPPAQPAVTDEPSDEPRIEHPLPEPPADSLEARPELPALPESDPALEEALAEAVGKDTVDDVLVPKDIVRRFVATVDNLPRRKVAEQLRPIKPVPGQFMTMQDGDRITLDPRNYERYTPYVRTLEKIDAQRLADVYIRFYPLFQQAYESLGYPSEYFNDRVVEVIDHLLATPEIQGPIELVQPKVFYEFADPKLERLSAGQKVLIRMGNENAAIVKRKLRELRTHLTGSSP
ncbi:MAG: DUF3014 domain-containing protein [Pseudomonadota bacterium]|nr:MAG: DUF3014 domain-containing protein [Pseudomonadota bacterium]